MCVQDIWHQLLQKVPRLWRKKILVYIEGFATNWFCPKNLSLLLTCKIRKGWSQKTFVNSEYTIEYIKLSFAYSELPVRMQNLLWACSFVGTKAGISQDVPFFYPIMFSRTPSTMVMIKLRFYWLIYYCCSAQHEFEPQPEISDNVVCATNKASDQPAHMRSLIRASASPLNILRVLKTDWTSFGVFQIKERLYRLIWVYTCQNAGLLEITCHSSFAFSWQFYFVYQFIYFWSL